MKSALNTTISAAWETLGADDPLWAILTRKDKRGNRWSVDEFFATGELDVRRLLDHRRACQITPPFRNVLDFGCGVGRLARVWAQHADSVTGVDVSSTMLDKGRDYNKDIPNLHFVHNTSTDLKVLGDRQYDLIFSYICLQHIPWPIASYIREFGRVCAPGGHVIFQLPTQPPPRAWIGIWRKKIIEGLPFGLGKLYRRMRGRSNASFDVFFIPTDDVLLVAQDAGLKLVRVFRDHSTGGNALGLIYLFSKY
jgi:SAM-dependent methyltransferase